MQNWSDFWLKNPEKSLKFAPKTKLNAMEERSLPCGGWVWCWGMVEERARV